MSTEPTAPEVCLDCINPIGANLSATPAPAAGSNESDDILNSSTFIAPELGSSSTEESPRVVIEFCDRCRWLSRATWTLTELFLTFPPNTPTTGLKAISLLPRSAPETGGRFRIWLWRNRPTVDPSSASDTSESRPEGWHGAELVWDRKIEGRFPEMKELKQRIRNLIEPAKDLGHSDKDAFGVKVDKLDQA